ncbi:MAG: ABC transporter permease [Pseudomonadota bacterium]
MTTREADAEGANRPFPLDAPARAERAPARDLEAMREMRNNALRIGLPALWVTLLLVGWDFLVTVNQIPQYILPRPGVVAQTVASDWHILWPALLNTLTITFGALFLATVGGVLLAVGLAQSKIVEYSISPIAVILQVTPIVAVFPLINIYVENIYTKLLLCAWIVAFFPTLSNSMLGLKSADRNLVALYRLYGASEWQTLRYLKLPSAMPYVLGGLRITGGLSLIGAVVAEYVAGSAGVGTGLASRLIEAAYRLNNPRLFAALFLLSLTGVLIYVVLSFVSTRILRQWHESALKDAR